jgi:hypothetical protein
MLRQRGGERFLFASRHPGLKQRIAIYAMPPPRSMTFLRQRLALPSVRSRRDCRVLGACETPGHEQHLINHGVHVPLDAGIATIGPLSVGQLNLFAHKVVLALHFAHFRRGLSADGNLCVLAVQEDFARSGIPSFFLDLLPSYGTISQGQWDERQTFEYRHALNIEEGLFGCLARFRRSYFVYGFTVDAADVLPESERQEWLRPAEVLSIPLARQKKL